MVDKDKENTEKNRCYVRMKQLIIKHKQQEQDFKWLMNYDNVLLDQFS